MTHILLEPGDLIQEGDEQHPLHPMAMWIPVSPYMLGRHVHNVDPPLRREITPEILEKLSRSTED